MKYYLVKKNVVIDDINRGTEYSVIERDNHVAVKFLFRDNGSLVMNGDTSYFVQLATEHPALLSLVMSKGLTSGVLEAHLRQNGFQRFEAS